MSHVHEKIDFVVSAWIVYEDKILLVYHKLLQMWLPVGGHVELDETTDQALFREVKEECGLDIEVIGEKPPYLEGSSARFLLRPAYVDIHPFDDKHQHIALEYFAKAKSNSARLSEREHEQIKWFTERELDDPQYNVPIAVKFLAKKALRSVK
ncbi:MAG: mutT/nudix family protein [Parcubacteria group bacterium Gr01-1014_30]|nr:MAG: mutT/nudix family protein [Parcubacteria group bacterium Gr01-1014_30]